jgi:hypothetical protein
MGAKEDENQQAKVNWFVESKKASFPSWEKLQVEKLFMQL